MTIETCKRRLKSLGWKAYELGLQDDGRWMICATGCGHIVYGTGHTRREAWSATCSTALKLALTGFHSETHDNLSSAQASESGGGRFSSLGDAMVGGMELYRLIIEYERLEKRAGNLFEEWNEIDQRMLEIERALPDDYPYIQDSN